jgi:hypothetical protein
VIALTEKVTNDERVLAAKLRELTLKIAERKFDAAHLPHATRRRLERKYEGRVEEIMARAAMECVEALNEAFADEV